MHMSQPSSGCNTWVNDLVCLHKSLQPSSLNIHNSQHPTHLEDVLMSTNPNDYATHDYLDFVHMAFDMWGPTTDDFKGAPKTFGLGPMFMDKFNGDQFSNLQASNLYYPFNSHNEWELASWLLHSGLSMRAIDSVLSLSIISLSLFSLKIIIDMHQIQLQNISFHTARALRGLAELLPGGPCWHSMEITPSQPTKHPVHIIHEPWIQVSSPQSLGYVTNIIFESFRDTFTSIAPRSLIVPLKVIPACVHSYSASFNQGSLSEDSLVSLYDDDRKCWNWELHPPPGSDSPPEQPRPLASELLVESEKLCFEKQVALFLNAIGTTAKSTMPSLSSKPQCQWMADWSRTSSRGSTGYS
ncbi:hypothetical protein F5J12DRAFT_782941 [Pisolithus orientalis]|uniref:uncharacterized protein n=1 Tax=Pisolithus orientalis TaxID=936130 RepID=UPI002224BE14|nr:uncharacterized protein F5J12DRAFT_782941 [Pisolithus orientalis]KAI6006706.1 hypothetical protein F5J12DRAFT_782941 [Pisolithus orientalis]